MGCKVNGLFYKNDFITDEEEDELLDKIYSLKWDTRLSRRVQHYGHIYEYNHIKNNITKPADPIPKWLLKVYDNLVKQKIAPSIDTNKLQIIINEYKIGQGIGKHIDDPTKFGTWVISLSLNSGCEILFENKKTGNVQKKFVNRCSVYKMEGDSRYLFTHQIVGKKFDLVNNQLIKRETRVSITFREIK